MSDARASAHANRPDTRMGEDHIGQLTNTLTYGNHESDTATCHTVEMPSLDYLL